MAGPINKLEAIQRPMSETQYKPTRLFTVDQANACLPLVRSIVADMVELARDLLERRQRLDLLAQGRKTQKGNVYSEELEQMEEELEKDLERLNGFAAELMDLGVEPKGAAEGLVDFPCMLEGRLCYLCWKYNEPEVLYWHELNAGFSGRQPLTASVGSQDSLNSSDEHL
jgi:hypothetical protein